jgi:hypothetical protein
MPPSIRRMLTPCSRARGSPGAALLWNLSFLLLATALRAGEAKPLFPDFDLRIESDGSKLAAGPARAKLRFEARVILTTTPPAESEAPEGASAWTLSIAGLSGARILDATTAGTAAAPVPEGFLDMGFELTELTSGPDNEGVISAVILSLVRPATLPPAGDAILLRLELEAAVESACREVRADFADGLRGSGLPVSNTVQWRNQTRRDDGGPRDTDADVAEPLSLRLCPAFLRGDTNADGLINLTDVLLVLNHLFKGGAPPGCLLAADADDDGSFNLTDAVYLLDHLFRGGSQPPPPFTRCGADPTPDSLTCEGRVACG